MSNQKLPQELKRTRQVMLRLSDIEYELIEKRAEKAGLPVAVFCRKAVLDKPVNQIIQITAELPQIQKLTNELSRIGGNLNQIAKYFNLGGIRSREMQEQIRKGIGELHEIREEAVKIGGLYGSHKTYRT